MILCSQLFIVIVLMSRNSLFSIQEFNQLILNASTYMNKIEAFSFKIANSDMEVIISCLSSAAQILSDPSCPILKKLFVLRFVKDTLILASLSFYLVVLIKIVPWLLQIMKVSESKQPQAKLKLMGNFLKGNKFSQAQDSKICSTILQLIEEMVKWIGINIRSHPYTKLQFRSAFRVILDRLPRVQNFKLSQLTFFKADDSNKYQAYYIERESGESEGEMIGDFILQILQGVEEGQEGQILEAMAQTGDRHVIAALVEELEGSLEVATPTNIHMKMNLIFLINMLVAVGQIELNNQIKNILLEKVVVIAQIIHKHKEEFEDSAKLISQLVGMMHIWNNKCQSLLLPVQVFRQAFKVLESYGVKTEGNSYEYQPKRKLGMIHEINKDKLNQLNCDEADSIKSLRACQYIPVYENLPLRKGGNQHQYGVTLHNYEFISSNKSQSKHSISSNSINQNRKQFLQAFSKYPQQMNQLKGNTSEVKELYLQHSNISEKNRIREGERPLIMSFKRPEPNADPLNISPEVVFSDSFTSNQKNSPFKNIHSQQFINLVNHPSKEMESQPSYNQQRVILPENTLSKNNLSSKKQSGVSKSLKNSENSQEEKMALIKDVKDSIKYNDYMLPEKHSAHRQLSHHYQFNKQSSVVSKQSKQKKEKSSYLARSNKKGSLLKNVSRSKLFSPPSRLGAQNNLIHFGQGNYERGSQMKEETAKVAVEAIQVEKTVAKPKFSFKVSEDSAITENQTVSIQLQTQNISQSLVVVSSNFSSSANSNSLSGVPDNFLDLLKLKNDRVKVNAFEDKAKELQSQIQKIRSKKLIMAQELNEKNMMLEQLRCQMPQPKEQLEEENKRLRNAIKAKKSGKKQQQYLYCYTHAVKGAMKHISVTPLKEDIKKLLLYSKCRLFKGESIQIGFQAKDGFLSFYLTFLRYVEECSVKLQTNSLILEEEIDAKMYKLAEGKQIKFKSKLKDYKLLQGEFRLSTLILRYKLLSKQAEIIQSQVPYYLYNLYKFHAPNLSTTYRKSSDWHYCCQEVLSNPHYITDYFPICKKQGSTFAIRGQIDDQLSSCRIIIDANKFLIEYQGVNEEQELMLVKCLMAIVERNS